MAVLVESPCAIPLPTLPVLRPATYLYTVAGGMTQWHQGYTHEKAKSQMLVRSSYTTKLNKQKKEREKFGGYEKK